MIPSPRRTVSQPPPAATSTSWADLDDDEGWQDMPVIRSDTTGIDLDEEDQRKYHYKPPARHDPLSTDANAVASSSNATGAHIELENDSLLTDSWREKVSQDESDYTRLRLDEDEESEEVHMRTRYLFDEQKAMTPLSQMQATKEILTEGQRIAYVGLCQLIARRMVRDTGRGWEGVKRKGKGKGKEWPMVESANIWMLKIMARLYQHMEVERDEQRMIESLAEHGVDPADLVPALMTTHTVKNPEFDPEAKKKAEAEAQRKASEAEEEVDEDVSDTETEAPPPPYQPQDPSPLSPTSATPTRSSFQLSSGPSASSSRASNPFGDDDEQEDESALPSSSTSTSPTRRSGSTDLPPFDDDDDDGDIGAALSPAPKVLSSESTVEEDDGDIGRSTSQHTPTKQSPKAIPIESALNVPESTLSADEEEVHHDPEKTPTLREQSLPGPELASEANEDSAANALPSLPGVSTHLTSADEVVTLDIRWTVLCDLFLVLIADSFYDARSRVFLERVAEALGFGWSDVVRFENRITEALEISESMEKTEQDVIIEGRRKGALRKRYAMMGLAAVGGGLVIGLSAGLMAPLIGAGLGAAFATVGITGTTGFLAGAGGAAIITTTGVLTGANIAGRGMGRRTREVRTFELRPLHNNQRVSCYITLGGFMSGKYDDVRLPFSVMDPIVGDVVSVYWEPEMMHEMGAALKIFTTEILTQVGQQVLAATVMTALMSALQWPMILTKLGYLIDNPWSNALDRSRAAGLVLADTIMQRHAGVRPVSLIGFSLGARVIYYALIELARAKAYGLVQDVFIFGSTLTASRATWLDVRTIVSGRFVNGYATNDWMLGYLFRATTGGLQTVAGLRPVDGVPGLENVDCTNIISGHMSYRSCMPQLLKEVGFPVTAEWFDEPEDPDVDMSVQERRIVNEAEEEAKKNNKKILGLFPRRGANSGSGTSTPVERKSVDVRETAKGEHNDEDLPPREEADLGSMAPSTAEHDDPKEREEAEKRRKAEEEARRAEEKALQAIPKTAGFDFKAISKELGRDIDLEKLREQPVPRESPLPTFSQSPVDRTGSAPPDVWVDPPTIGDSIQRSHSSYGVRSPTSDDDDEGDITYATTQARQMSLSDTSSWGQPTTTPRYESTSISPPLSTGSSSKSFNFGFNAWSGSSTSPNPFDKATSPIPSLRAAPPARPHPAELMMDNPFANAGTSTTSNGNGKGGIIWADKMETGNTRTWRKDEDLATNNPW